MDQVLVVPVLLVQPILLVLPVQTVTKAQHRVRLGLRSCIPMIEARKPRYWLGVLFRKPQRR